MNRLGQITISGFKKAKSALNRADREESALLGAKNAKKTAIVLRNFNANSRLVSPRKQEIVVGSCFIFTSAEAAA